MGKTIINHPFGKGLYQLSMVMTGGLFFIGILTLRPRGPQTKDARPVLVLTDILPARIGDSSDHRGEANEQKSKLKNLVYH